MYTLNWLNRLILNAMREKEREGESGWIIFYSTNKACSFPLCTLACMQTKCINATISTRTSLFAQILIQRKEERSMSFFYGGM